MRADRRDVIHQLCACRPGIAPSMYGTSAAGWRVRMIAISAAIMAGRLNAVTTHATGCWEARGHVGAGGGEAGVVQCVEYEMPLPRDAEG